MPDGPRTEAEDTRPFSMEEIAELHVLQGSPERAIPLLRKVVEGQPHRVDLLDRIATIEHSVLTLQRRCRTREMHPEVLAEALDLMDMPERALDRVDQLLEQRPGDERLIGWAKRLRLRIARAAAAK